MIARLPIAGHEAYRWNSDSQEEWTTWIGKPWRRLEYLRQRVFDRGELLETARTWTVDLGLRRLGLHFHLSVTHQPEIDYADEPNQ